MNGHEGGRRKPLCLPWRLDKGLETLTYGDDLERKHLLAQGQEKPASSGRDMANLFSHRGVIASRLEQQRRKIAGEKLLELLFLVGDSEDLEVYAIDQLELTLLGRHRGHDLPTRYFGSWVQRITYLFVGRAGSTFYLRRMREAKGRRRNSRQSNAC